MLTADQLNDIATLARMGLKVFTNDDRSAPGQIASAASTLDQYIAWKDAELAERAKPKESEG